MPASLYSEPEAALYNTDTEDYDSVYGDFEVGSAGTPVMDCILCTVRIYKRNASLQKADIMHFFYH